MNRKKRRRSPPERRAIPEIFVKSIKEEKIWRGKSLCKAHLRNKKGYIYLQWKDGDEVRSFYLGKAPRKSTTQSSRTSAAGSAKKPGLK